MKHLLQNPVYHALLSGDHHQSFGSEEVRWFDEQQSPFVGFHHNYATGFDDLYALLPASRKILYANPDTITQPAGWNLKHEIKGLQFVYEGSAESNNDYGTVSPLAEIHVAQMSNLAAITKPGPFASKTINFGHYFGIFDGDKLVAMTGQRLHVHGYTEISAVCTLPGYTGRGYAYTLMMHQLQLILQQGQQPFLHVRADNERAINLYQRIGFAVSRPMNFYFMQRS